MSAEEYYDDVIAPVLLDLAKKCEAEGLSLIAMCEYGPNETGSTFSIQEGAGVEIRMAHMGMKARGNADSLLMGIKKYGEKHGHNSFMLELLNPTNRAR